MEPALRRLGVPETVRSFILTSYEQLQTQTEFRGSVAEIQLKRGVKQGDQVSPYTLNAIMNPLLEQLEALKGYTIDTTHTISSLAFADDVILVADHLEKAQELLTHTELHFKSLGMALAAQKCAFQISTT